MKTIKVSKYEVEFFKALLAQRRQSALFALSQAEKANTNRNQWLKEKIIEEIKSIDCLLGAFKTLKKEPIKIELEAGNEKKDT